MKGKLRSYLLITAILCLAADLSAQKPLFTVIASNGKALYINKNLAAWTDLTAGSRLFQGDRIKLEENAYVGLCCSSGRTMELTSPGEFDAGGLYRKLHAMNNSVTQKWTSYILDEIVDKNRTKEMTTLAGVVRSSLTYIDKDFPASDIISGREVTFRWYSSGTLPRYIFGIENPEGQTVLLQETEDTSITVNTEMLNLMPGVCYSWYVYDAENPFAGSDTSCIKTITPARREEVEDSLRQLAEGLGDMDSPLNQMIIGSFYENSGMYTDALRHYEKALEKGGSAEEYRKKYILFLMKAGLYRRADNLLAQWQH